MKNGGKFLMVLIVSCVFMLIVSVYLYITKEDNDFSRANENYGTLVSEIKEMKKDQIAFAQSTVTQMARLNEQMKDLDKIKKLTVNEHGSLKVSLTQPIQIKLIYKRAEELSKSPLLNRAGIKKEKGN